MRAQPPRKTCNVRVPTWPPSRRTRPICRAARPWRPFDTAFGPRRLPTCPGNAVGRPPAVAAGAGRAVATAPSRPEPRAAARHRPGPASPKGLLPVAAAHRQFGFQSRSWATDRRAFASPASIQPHAALLDAGRNKAVSPPPRPERESLAAFRGRLLLFYLRSGRSPAELQARSPRKGAAACQAPASRRWPCHITLRGRCGQLSRRG